MSALGAVLGKRTWLGAGAILLAAAGGGGAAALLSCLCAALGRLGDPLGEVLLSCLFCTGLALAMEAVLLPILLRFGSKTGGYALLAVTLWVYRPVSLAEAADARTGLEPKVVVVVRLEEMDGNGTSHEYQAYDPALLEQMELLVDTARLRLVRRSSIAPLDGMCKIVIIGEDEIICSFDYNLTTNAIYIGDRIYALRSTQSEPLSELTAAICGEV